MVSKHFCVLVSTLEESSLSIGKVLTPPYREKAIRVAFSLYHLPKSCIPPIYRIHCTTAYIPHSLHYRLYTAFIALPPIYRIHCTTAYIPHSLHYRLYTAFIALPPIYRIYCTTAYIPHSLHYCLYTAFIALLPIYRIHCTTAYIPHSLHYCLYTSFIALPPLYHIHCTTAYIPFFIALPPIYSPFTKGVDIISWSILMLLVTWPIQNEAKNLKNDFNPCMLKSSSSNCRLDLWYFWR